MEHTFNLRQISKKKKEKRKKKRIERKEGRKEGRKKGTKDFQIYDSSSSIDC